MPSQKSGGHSIQSHVLWCCRIPDNTFTKQMGRLTWENVPEQPGNPTVSLPSPHLRVRKQPANIPQASASVVCDPLPNTGWDTGYCWPLQSWPWYTYCHYGLTLGKSTGLCLCYSPKRSHGHHGDEHQRNCELWGYLHSWFKWPWCVLTHCAKTELIQSTLLQRGVLYALTDCSCHSILPEGLRLKIATLRPLSAQHLWDFMNFVKLTIPLSITAVSESHACCFAAVWIAQCCWKAFKDTASQWGNLV